VQCLYVNECGSSVFFQVMMFGAQLWGRRLKKLFLERKFYDEKLVSKVERNITENYKFQYQNINGET
jgi:carbohydrate-selective porin OprB